jgi:hypothetical protein
MYTEEYSLLGCKAVETERRFGATYDLHLRLELQTTETTTIN